MTPPDTPTEGVQGGGVALPETSTGRSFVVDVNQSREHNQVHVETEPGNDEPSHEAGDGEVTPAKKKKKKKNKSKKKAALPSGFEENYADAPITPDEYLEETRDIYHPSRSFAERIESCIQRYRSKRRFDPERQAVFDKYLSLGGVDTGPKMFSGGVDRAALEEMDAADIVNVTATDFVGQDKSEMGQAGSAWVVDFEAVAKCFFSSRVPFFIDYERSDQMARCVAVVRNFLNYLLYHNVCPEYTNQVNAARAVCDLAAREVPATKLFSLAIPGDFNMACSTLYDGYYRGLYNGDQDWAKDSGLTVGMSDDHALKVLKAGLAAYGTAEQIQHVESGRPVHVVDVSVPNTGFEVTSILPADDRVRDLYTNTYGGSFKTLGRIRAKPWIKPYAAVEDVTDDEDEDEDDDNDNYNDSAIPSTGGKAKSKSKSTSKASGSIDQPEYEFWIEEEDLLEQCFVGMKIEAKIRTLNMGLRFFDNVAAVYCSFYTRLPNEMLAGWKAPLPLNDAEREEAAATTTGNDDDDQPRAGDDDAGGGDGGVSLNRDD